jgi:hypothetical protein
MVGYIQQAIRVHIILGISGDKLVIPSLDAYIR